MALTGHTKRQMAQALGSQAIATQLAAIVDAGSGSASTDATRRIWNAYGSTPLGVVLVAAFAADTALTALQKGKLTQILGATAAADLVAHQGV